MITIPEDDFLQTLAYGYKQFMSAYKADNKQELIRLKEWCNAMERIAFVYKPDLKDQLLEMRSKIVIIDKKTDLDEPDNWETPTYIWKKLKVIQHRIE